MNTWLEFEDRFRALAESLKHHRLDIQTGDQGEYFRIAGAYDVALLNQFESICQLAGGELVKLNIYPTDWSHTNTDVEPKVIWYRLLARQSGAYKPNPSGYSINEEDDKKLWIHSGTIYKFPEVSANLCLELHRSNPIEHEDKPKAGLLRHLWEDYGKQILIGTVVAGISVMVGFLI